jgi:site-specific DNA-methyltransferase (adenine-specific)
MIDELKENELNEKQHMADIKVDDGNLKLSDIINKIILGDSINVMRQIPNESIDLIFADPPYNIGVKYDNYNDNLSQEEYLKWADKWLNEMIRILKRSGSIYIAINDENAAEIVLKLKSKGLFMRNWIIWYYTFGEHQSNKFTRSHTHILYFVKDKNKFTFNKDNIRLTSVRQKIGDKRANPKGRIPDDVWYDNLDDVWKISRIAGTFKERVKNFPCQMPIKVLERIILASSNENDIVLDPFAGSGTTLVVAKQYTRKYIGIEISKKYAETIQKRMDSSL